MNERANDRRSNLKSLSLSRARRGRRHARTNARERAFGPFVRSVRPFRPFGPFRPSVRPSVAHCAPSIESVVHSTRGRGRGRRSSIDRAVGGGGRSSRSGGRRRDRRDRGGRSSRRDLDDRYLHRRVVNGRACVLLSVSSSIHPFVPRTLLVVISAEWYYSRVRTHPWVRPRSVPRFSGGKM